MPPKSQQIPILQSQAKGGGGGAASLAQFAISNFVNDQNQAQKKMMDNFTKLQEAQAQQSAQDSAQMTQAMNQVVAREDERVLREENRQEKMGDRKHQERFHEWTAQLQEQAAKDSAAVQLRVSNQMAAGRDFIQRMDTNRTEFGDRIGALRMKLNDPNLMDYWNNTPGGHDRYQKLQRLLRVGQAFQEQDSQSDYTGQVAIEMSKIAEQVLADEPHADLTQLYGVKPNELLTGDRMTDDWTDDEVEELMDNGGYPPGGLYGRDVDDPSLDKYKNFNPVDYMTQISLMEDEQAFAMLQNSKFQDDWLAMKLESEKDGIEARRPLQEFKTKDYDRMSETAVEAVYFGAAGFVDEMARGMVSPDTLTLKSGELGPQGPLDTMASRLLESTLLSLGGPGSEGKLKVLDDLARGEGDGSILDTGVEMYMGFHLENMLRHIDDQLLSMTIAPKDGVPMTMALATQIFDMPDTPEKTSLIRSLVEVPGDRARGQLLQPIKTGALGRLSPVVLGQIHRGVNRMFRMAKQKANQYRDLLSAQPALRTHRMEVGRSARYVDALVASYFSDKKDVELQDDERRRRALRGASQGQRQEAILATDPLPEEGFDLEDATLQEAIKLSPMQAGAELWAEFAHRPEFLAALFSGDYENVPIVTGPVTEEDLRKNMGLYKRNRERIKAEMQRRREAHAKKHPELEPQPEQEAPPAQPQEQAPEQGAPALPNFTGGP